MDEIIAVNTAIEAIQKRPGMYIGSVDRRGFDHLISDLIISLIEKSDINEVDYTIHQDNIQLQLKNINRELPLDLAITFNNSELILGFIGINALSEYLKIEFIDKNNQTYLIQNYHLGKIDVPPTSDKVFIKDIKLDFNLNKKIWKTIDQNIQYEVSNLSKIAMLKKGLTININHQISNELLSKVLSYPNGMLSHISDISQINKNAEKIFYFENIINGEYALEIACLPAFSEDRAQLTSYGNYEESIDHGTHVKGLLTGVSQALKKHLEDHPTPYKYKFIQKKLLKNLTGIVHVRGELLYCGPTKREVGNPELIPLIAANIRQPFLKYLKENRTIAESYLDLFEEQEAVI